jgi:hypothetical protein
MMDAVNERLNNQAAYRELKSFIQNQYPLGTFVAIAGGEIVAEARSFDELNTTLNNQGYHSADVLVVQGGIEYLDTVTIFL